MRRLALVFALATACKGHPAGTATPGDRPQSAARRSDPELAAVADRIDPGPQRPMYEILPQWLKAKADADADPRSPEALTEAREAIAGWPKVQGGDREAVLLAVQRLGRGLVLAERAFAAGDHDPELLAALAKAYQYVHDFKALRDNQTLKQLVQAVVERSFKAENVAAQQIDELVAALSQAIDHAPPLYMHVAAQLLRDHPDHPMIPEALAAASHAAIEAEDHAAGVQLRKLAVTRKGDRANGVDFADLAGACYVGLDLPCGDMALKTAEDRGAPTPAESAEFSRRLWTAYPKADVARKIVALAAREGLEPQVERGYLLLQLNHRKDAEATFTAAHTAHPKDARPLAGLAVATAQLTGDFDVAAAHLRAASKLENRDRRYYEVALGMLPGVVIRELMSAAAAAPAPGRVAIDARFDELQQAIEGYRAFDPARATVLATMLTLARDAFPKFLAGEFDAGLEVVRKLPARALALTQWYPESRDVWLLVFASVRLIPDAKRARAQVMTPLPAALADDPGIRLQQARALLDIAFMWEDRVVLAEAIKAAERLPGGVDYDVAADIRATLDAVQGRQGDRAATERAAAAFARLANRKTGKEQALALNNLAMTVAQAGDVAKAREILTYAQSADVNVPTASYNAFALTFDASDLYLAQLTQPGDTPTIRMHAQAWRVANADAGHGDARAMRAQFATILAEERKRGYLGTMLFGRWGVAMQPDFKLSLGYNPVDGLVMVDEVLSRWWQFTPAPKFDALLPKARTKPAR